MCESFQLVLEQPGDPAEERDQRLQGCILRPVLFRIAVYESENEQPRECEERDNS